jgi:UPF0271 protein
VRRGEEGALLVDPDVVGRRAVRMVTEGDVVAVDGSVVALQAESVCVHGDSPGAVELARAVRTGLEQAGVRLAAFT